MRGFLTTVCCFVLVASSVDALHVHHDNRGNLESHRSPATVRIHHERSTDSEMKATVTAFGETHHLSLRKFVAARIPLQEIIINEWGNPVLQTLPEDSKSAIYFEDKSSNAILYMNDKNTLEGMLSHDISLKFEDNEHVATKINAVYFKPHSGNKYHHSNADLSHSRSSETAGNSNENSNEDSDETSDETSREINTEYLQYSVEVLTVIDSELLGILGSDDNAVNFLTVYWMLVNRIYQRIQRISIDLRLSSIILSRSRNTDLLFLDNFNTFRAHSTKSLKKFSGYIGKYHSYLNEHDIAQFLTNRNLYVGSSYSVNGESLHIGIPCYVENEEAYYVSIVEEKGYFAGAMLSVHEVAHTLGAYDDGEPQSASCSWDSGYIMSDERFDYKTFLFSNCSIDAMRDVYDEDWATCLSTVSGDAYQFPDSLPGENKSFDDQCKDRTGYSDAVADPRYQLSDHCVRLRCKDGKHYFDTVEPALEATACDSAGGVCTLGVCVAPLA
uniref:Venom metalloproteinase antarease-like TtrivMP_A n=1 Tax=Hirondellea gigas TaxID=1518452 RepID=A0A6A7FMD6_9CRUS